MSETISAAKNTALAAAVLFFAWILLILLSVAMERLIQW